MAKNKTDDTLEKDEITFSKESILKFKRYRFRVDLLTVLLDESKAYTISEVDALIENFMKGKVN